MKLMERSKTTLCCLLLLFALSDVLYHTGAETSRPAALQPNSILPGSSQSTTIELEPILTGLDSPLYITSARDGSNRLFIVERPGRIKVLQPGARTPTIFLDIVSRVLSGGGNSERGLLGLAFHPQFKSNHRFFVNYTRRPDGATVIAEYQASASNPNVAEIGETVLLTIAQPFSNHNGGMIEFGPDGLLYIGMGDGGSANDPDNRAQNIQDLLGKMLRIDIDNPEGPSKLYSSPPSNPFFGPDNPGRDEIYAIGLRNPWRFSYDRETGQLYAADVGQGAIEEIDIIIPGGNYGWRIFEGTRCTNLGPTPCTAGGFIPPIAEYNHTGGRCSVTGGYVYRGRRSSLPAGAYVYGDFCTGEIFLLENGAQRVLLNTDLLISSFGEDEAGEIYVVGLGATANTGTAHRIINPNAPRGALQFSLSDYSVNEDGGSAAITVTRVGGIVGQVSVNYSTGPGSATAGADYIAASGTITFADGDASGKTFLVPILDDLLVEGNETVNLSLSGPAGGATLGDRSTAVLTIIDNDFDITAPAVTITRPANNSFSNSRTISVRGTVIDDSSGVASVLVNNTPAEINNATGRYNATVTAPADGQFTITIIATDLAGNRATATVNIIIDTVEPSIVFVTPPIGGRLFAAISNTVTITATDSGSGIDLSSVRINDIVATQNSTGSFSATLSGLKMGSFTITASARDNAGNVAGVSNAVTVTARPGDLTGDGEINVQDLIRLIQVLVGAEPLNAASDVNLDGKTDVQDLIRLIQAITGANPLQ